MLNSDLELDPNRPIDLGTVIGTKFNLHISVLLLAKYNFILGSLR